MSATLTPKNLADLAQTLLCKPGSLGELETIDKHRQFVTDMARLIAAHCGGAVPKEATVSDGRCTVEVMADDSVAANGGIWAAISGTAAGRVMSTDMQVSEVRTGSSWAPKYNGVLVTHLPTGVSVQRTDSRSAHINRQEAIDELLANPVVIAYVAKGMRVDVSLEPLRIAGVLEQARRYVVGAYECAFPDEDENAQVLSEIDELLVRLKNA